MGLDAVSGRLLGGVEVRDETKARTVARAFGGGNPCGDVGVVGNVDIASPELAELVGKHAGEIELNVGRRHPVAVLVCGLRIDLDVAQEALEDIGLMRAHGQLLKVGPPRGRTWNAVVSIVI